MKLKKGVKINGIKPEMVTALIVADNVWQDFGEELVVTSCTDSIHSLASLHYVGYAVDLRIKYFDKDEKIEIAQALRDALTDEFDVVLESTHIHLEFQPKKK